MGANASKPEDVQALARTQQTFNPPLGPPNPANPLVYFDIKLGRYGEGTPLGRIVMVSRLQVIENQFDDMVPSAAHYSLIGIY